MAVRASVRVRPTVALVGSPGLRRDGTCREYRHPLIKDDDDDFGREGRGRGGLSHVCGTSHVWPKF